MNKLICSLIAAVGFGTLPAANAETASGEASVSAHRTSAHRTLTRKHHRHHRHHRHHHHHSKGKK
jgi:Ni/Co efflux regulator RcnB